MIGGASHDRREAEIRSDDLKEPSLVDAIQQAEESEAEPGKGENAPGFLKPEKK